MSKTNIIQLWTFFRESERKEDGKIPFSTFDEGMRQILIQAQDWGWQEWKTNHIIKFFFKRFNYYPSSSSKLASGEHSGMVGIYDFLISLTVISRMRNREKIITMFQLIDVDEDRCLSIGELFKMINKIETNFVTNLNYLNYDSGLVYKEFAYTNAFWKFYTLMTLMTVSDINDEDKKKKYDIESMTEKSINQTLISFPEFLNVLDSNPIFFDSLLPFNLNLREFLVKVF